MSGAKRQAVGKLHSPNPSLTNTRYWPLWIAIHNDPKQTSFELYKCELSSLHTSVGYGLDANRLRLLGCASGAHTPNRSRSSLPRCN